MADNTGIEWTDATWNPVRGCTRVSEGCRNCYAERVAARFSGAGQPYEGLARYVDRPDGTREARWTGKLALVDSALDQPLRWRRPRKIFVNSMSDLFHEAVPDEWIDKVFAVMALAPQHTFQILTKRAQRMHDYIRRRDELGRIPALQLAQASGHTPWPLPNVWLGVSVEDKGAADERMPILRATPAALRFLSIEPLLSPLGKLDLTGIGWVIVGGESGPGARPIHPLWVRHIQRQCFIAGVPFFFKQWGEWEPWRPAHIDHPTADRIRLYVDGSVWRGRGLDINIHDEEIMVRVGKKAAGRALDGRVWEEFPKQQEAQHG